jgi:aspartyl/glutamyl-tRNA(Asn/Gln) amidotransferase C subunit
MAKTLSAEEVKKIGTLVNLTLSNEEVKKLSKMLTDTFGYIDVLDELDTANVIETFQVTGLTNVFMEGEDNLTTLPKEQALANAKEVVQDKFATEAVFDR